MVPVLSWRILAFPVLLGCGCACPHAGAVATPLTKQDLACVVTPPMPAEDASSDAWDLGFTFEDGFRRRAGSFDLGLKDHFRVFDFREQIGFATFEQKVSVCRVVITDLDNEQTAYMAGLTDVPVLSVNGASPGVKQLAPSLDQLAAALGRYAVETGKRNLVVFASSDAAAQRASQEVTTSAKVLPLEDAATTAPTLSAGVDLVVIVTTDIAAMRSVSEGFSASIPLALVTLEASPLALQQGWLRVLPFAENDPDIDPSLVERWRQFDPSGPACRRARKRGTSTETACAARFDLAALGEDAAVLAGAVLGNDEASATDMQVVERLLAGDAESGSDLFVAARNKFPIVQERNGEQEFVGRF